MSKIYGISGGGGGGLFCIEYSHFIPRMDLNFRHLSSCDTIEALISLMRLVPTFSGITDKQRLFPGYAGEIPFVTAARKISSTRLKLMLAQ